MSQLGFATVPWNDRDGWTQMKLSLEVTIVTQRDRLHATKVLSDQIAVKLQSIDPCLETLCNQTCVNCNDICCGRATLWYDYRDILFIYLSSSRFPQQQITKKSDLTCSCLGPSGCRLKRSERPFICTWYICPQQTNLMKKTAFRESAVYLTSILQEIKTNRKTLEQMFMEVVC